MTDADKKMHPQHFGTDPTDIRIRINPKIRIRIPDHFRTKFWRGQRFALSECSCCYSGAKPLHVASDYMYVDLHDYVLYPML